MIVIATYTNASDAYRAKNILETNGIHCKLHNDLLSKTETIGKIELLVAAHDSTLARDVLANAIDEEK